MPHLLCAMTSTGGCAGLFICSPPSQFEIMLQLCFMFLMMISQYRSISVRYLMTAQHETCYMFLMASTNLARKTSFVTSVDNDILHLNDGSEESEANTVLDSLNQRLHLRLIGKYNSS